MKQEYELIHHFKSKTKKERSENLYRLLSEYKDHLHALESETKEGMDDVDGSSLY